MIVTIPVKAACRTTFQRTATCCSKFERLSINLFRSASSFFWALKKLGVLKLRKKPRIRKPGKESSRWDGDDKFETLREDENNVFLWEPERQIDPGEVLPEKLGGDVRPASPKTLPYSRPKSVIFPFLIYELTKNSKPYRYLWPEPFIKILFQACVIIWSLVNVKLP